jgi:hypothetical protein
MVLQNVIELENGQTVIQVLDCGSGLVNNYTIPTGTLMEFMRELRQKG